MNFCALLPPAAYEFASIGALAKVLDTSPHKHCSRIKQEQLRDVGKQLFAQVCFFLEVKELSKKQAGGQTSVVNEKKSALNKMQP